MKKWLCFMLFIVLISFVIVSCTSTKDSKTEKGTDPTLSLPIVTGIEEIKQEVKVLQVSDMKEIGVLNIETVKDGKFTVSVKVGKTTVKIYGEISNYGEYESSFTGSFKMIDKNVLFGVGKDEKETYLFIYDLHAAWALSFRPPLPEVSKEYLRTTEAEGNRVYAFNVVSKWVCDELIFPHKSYLYSLNSIGKYETTQGIFIVKKIK